MLAACAPATAVPPTATPRPTVALTATLTRPAPTAYPAPARAETPTPSATLDSVRSATPAGLPSPTPEARLAPERWQEWPVIPDLSVYARQVLRDGLARGANPRAFAKVGDCETLTDWFLVDFDKGPRYYNLGPYAALQPVIDAYTGSFQRKSIASARGFTAASALSTFWSDPQICKAGEVPLACEYRVQKPVAAFIMLGTNDVNHKATFEANLRKIIELSLAQGVLPVLTTKADNLEGDQQINRTIAALAYAYDIPLWNYWLAVQGLPDRGLQTDGAHLTFGPNRFDQPENLQFAWPVRNLNALQVLERIQAAVQVAAR